MIKYIIPICLCLCCSISAQDPKIESYIRNLGDADYTIRADATNLLSKLGIKAQPALGISVNSRDPEVAARSRNLMHTIMLTDMWSATMVDIPATTYGVESLIKKLNKESPTQLSLGDSLRRASQKQVKIQQTTNELWPLIDDICRQSGNTLGWSFDFFLRPRKPLILSTGAHQHPVAYAGSLRLAIKRIKTTISAELDFVEQSEPAGSCKVAVQLFPEGKTRIVAYDASPLMEATTNDKMYLRTNGNIVPSGFNLLLANETPPQCELTLNLPTATATSFATATITWDMVAAGYYNTVTLPFTVGATYQEDGITATIDSIDYVKLNDKPTTVTVVTKISGSNYDLMGIEQQHQDRMVDLVRCEIDLHAVGDDECSPIGLLYQKTATKAILPPDGDDAEPRNPIIYSGIMISSSFSISATPAAFQITYPRLRSRQSVVFKFKDLLIPALR